MSLGMMMKCFSFTFVFAALFLCSCRNHHVQTEDTSKTITEEMAFEGVSNYCHEEYDWSVAKDNPGMMYLQMGEESDSTYQVVFRSYTGAIVHFYVNKASGTTRIEEEAPFVPVEEGDGVYSSSAETIDLFDYLE